MSQLSSLTSCSFNNQSTWWSNFRLYRCFSTAIEGFFTLCKFVPMYQFTYVPPHPRRPGMPLWERICHSPIAPASKFEPMPAVPNIFRLLFALWAQWCFTSVNEIELLYSTCNNPQQLDNDLFCQFLSPSTLRNSTLDLAINAHQCSTSLSCSIGQLIRPQRYAKCWETKTSSTPLPITAINTSVTGMTQ